MEYLLKPFLGLDKDSDTKANIIVGRVLLWIFLLSITAWLAEKVGYPVASVDFSFQTLVNLFTKYYLVLALVILFASHSVLSIFNILVLTILNLCVISFYFKVRYLRNKTMADFLVEQNVLQRLEPIEKDKKKQKYIAGSAFVETDRKNRKTLETPEKNRSMLEDWQNASVAILFTYELIIPDKFPLAYFVPVAVLLWIAASFFAGCSCVRVSHEGGC